jgi:hypothetical protein
MMMTISSVKNMYITKMKFFIFIHVEAEKRPLRKIIAKAGTNLTLACDALHEKSLLKIEKLTWKSSQTIIAKYHIGDGKPTVSNKSSDQQQNQERVSGV